MKSDRLQMKITQIKGQIADLEFQLQDLNLQLEAANYAEGKVILEKKKITPAELNFLISMSEEEKRLILERRKKVEKETDDVT